MKKMIFAVVVLGLAGCASTPPLGNVIPEAGGHYQAIGLGSSSEGAMGSALYTAEMTCKPQHMHHIVTGQQMQYKGALSEGANRAVSSVTQAVSSLTHAWVPSMSRDDDYQVILSFTCEA